MHSQRQRWRPIHARLASACERVAARPTYLARARSAPRLPRRARPRTGTRTGMKGPGDDCVAVSCGARSVHAPAAHRPRADGWSLELEPRLCHQIKLLQPAIHSFLDANRTKQHNESTQTRPLQHNRGYRARIRLQNSASTRLPSRIFGIKRMSGESLSPSCACFLWVSSSSTGDGLGG
jgi:hypothetical protein